MLRRQKWNSATQDVPHRSALLCSPRLANQNTGHRWRPRPARGPGGWGARRHSLARPRLGSRGGDLQIQEDTLFVPDSSISCSVGSCYFFVSSLHSVLFVPSSGHAPACAGPACLGIPTVYLVAQRETDGTKSHLICRRSVKLSYKLPFHLRMWVFWLALAPQ